MESTQVELVDGSPIVAPTVIDSLTAGGVVFVAFLARVGLLCAAFDPEDEEQSDAPSQDEHD